MFRLPEDRMAADGDRTATRLERPARHSHQPQGAKRSSCFYPSPREIADAWSIPEIHDSRSGRTVDYFWNNQKNRITTYQDPEIEAHLRHLGLTR